MFGRVFILSLLLLGFATPALAYTDPGTMGLAAQIGYMFLFGVSSVLLFFFKPIKNLFRRKPESSKEPE